MGAIEILFVGQGQFEFLAANSRERGYEMFAATVPVSDPVYSVGLSCHSVQNEVDW